MQGIPWLNTPTMEITSYLADSLKEYDEGENKGEVFTAEDPE